MKKFIFVLAIIFFVYQAHADDLTGTGCAKSRSKALEYALADISQQIEVRIESELYTHKMQSNGKAADYISYKTRIKSDLPILGFTTVDVKDCVNATLSAKKAMPLYIREAEKYRTRINSLTQKTDLPDNIKLTNYSRALEEYAEWSKLALVASYLGGSLTPPEANMGDIEKDVIAMKRVSADIPQIAANILNGIPTQSLYINAVKLYGSQATPPFASLLTQQLRQQAKGSPEGSRHQLNCQYSPEGDPFIIGCELNEVGIHKPSKLILTSVSRKICEQVNCYNSPSIVKLEKSFHSVGDAGLKGYFYSNWGSDSVILSEGDIIQLFTRVNSPSEVALIAMTSDGNAKLIPLSDSGTRKIVDNETNRQVELTKLKVTPPFGDESLILIGYAGDLASLLAKDSFNITELNKLRQKISDKPYFEKKIMLQTNERAL